MKRLLLLFTLALCPLSLIYAQNADDIIAKHVAAMGGKDKLMSIQNIYMEGTTVLGGAPVNVRSWLVIKKAARIEYSVNSMTTGYIVTNDSGWSYNSMGPTEPLTEKTVLSAQPALDPEGLLVNYKANGYKVEYKGTDKIEDKVTYKIHEKISGSLTNIYYIDTASYHIVRITTKAVMNGEHLDLTQDFGTDQQIVNGLSFPINGDVKITTIKVNTDINPSLFKPKR